jgi:hypothetical protein
VTTPFFGVRKVPVFGFWIINIWRSKVDMGMRFFAFAWYGCEEIEFKNWTPQNEICGNGHFARND